METITTAAGQAAEGLSVAFTDQSGGDINKKPAAAGTVTGSISEAKGTCSMSNHSTPANGGVVQFVKPCVGKTLNALGIKHNHQKRAFNCQHPDHDDKHASASYGEKTNTKNGTTLWNCHGCGRGGDAVDLVKIVNNTDYAGAMDFLQSAGLVAGNVATNNVNGAKPPKIHATLQKAVDALIYGQNQTGGKWVAAITTPYVDINGLVVAYVARLENEEGKKHFGQITPRDGGYVNRGPDSGVPPLNLPELDKTKPLVIVEGEKAAYAAEKLGLQATTWMGGAKATPKTDWAALKGFNCIIWPDNDEPGKMAAAEVAGRLAGIASRIRILPLGDDLDAKDDAADVLEKYGPDGGRRWFDSQLELADDHKADAVAVQSASRPTIVIPLDFNDPQSILNQITPLLGNAGIYQRDGHLCRIVEARESEISGLGKLVISGPVADRHDDVSITPVIGQAVAFYKESVTKTGEIRVKGTPPPGDLMKQLIRLKSWPGTPHLFGITSGPFMRHDGTICTQRGYDAASGWYLDYDGKSINVPDKPTESMARDAITVLKSLVEEFEWQHGHDVIFLSYLLTLIARPGIVGNIPAHVLTANVPGGGKTLTQEICNIIAFGKEQPVYAAPQDQKYAPDEWKKLLFSFAKTGALSLVVDNVPTGSAIGTAALDMVLTSSRVIERNMKTHDAVEAAWVAAVMVTGNNLASGADFIFRSVWGCFESKEVNPRQRTGFKIPNLKQYVRQHRHDFLRKALIVLRWHAANGFPAAGGQHFGSFEEWARVVRDPILLLTQKDVTANNRTAKIADQEADELAMLIEALEEYQQSENRSDEFKIGAIDLYNDLTDPNKSSAWMNLRGIFDATKSRSALQSQFGKLINKHKGRIVDIDQTGNEKKLRKIVVSTISRRVYARVVSVGNSTDENA